MRPTNKTDDAISAALLFHYIHGKFEKNYYSGKVFLGPDSRAEYGGPQYGKLAALCGLPPNGEILHRDFWLIKAASFVRECDTNSCRAAALKKYLHNFRRQYLNAWVAHLASHQLPSILPLGARTVAIWEIVYEYLRADDPLLLVAHIMRPVDYKKEFRQRAMVENEFATVRYCLYFAFANSLKMPESSRAIFAIINRSFDGLAGKLSKFLYDSVTAPAFLPADKK